MTAQDGGRIHSANTLEVECMVYESLTGNRPVLEPSAIATTAATMLLRLYVWGNRSQPFDGFPISVWGSLCLAAGGGIDGCGSPTPPTDPTAAAALADTCELLAANIAGCGQIDDSTSAAHRLDACALDTNEDMVAVQHLLFTLHRRTATKI